jgi:hypothetical protein
MATYTQILPAVFPYAITFDTAAEARALIARLIEPTPDNPSGDRGSSFAYTARQPEFTVWISSASRDRIRDEMGDYDLWARTESPLPSRRPGSTNRDPGSTVVGYHAGDL